MVKVKAIRKGYYNHKRIKEGEVFFMDEDEFYGSCNIKNEPRKDKDGNPDPCRWAVRVDNESYDDVEEMDEIDELNKHFSKKKKKRSHQKEDHSVKTEYDTVI